jgi:hypothetical protein
VLDAKYRIDIAIKDELKLLNNTDLISEDLTGKTLVFKPKDSDINTMHRYKDAIQKNVCVNGNAKPHKVVKRGIILYPYKPKRTELTIIKEYVNKMDVFKIGSIPLCPGKEDRDWINKYSNIDEIVFDDSLLYEQIRILANQVKRMIDQDRD